MLATQFQSFSTARSKSKRVGKGWHLYNHALSSHRLFIDSNCRGILGYMLRHPAHLRLVFATNHIAATGLLTLSQPSGSTQGRSCRFDVTAGALVAWFDPRIPPTLEGTEGSSESKPRFHAVPVCEYVSLRLAYI